METRPPSPLGKFVRSDAQAIHKVGDTRNTPLDRHISKLQNRVDIKGHNRGSNEHPIGFIERRGEFKGDMGCVDPKTPSIHGLKT